MRELRVTAARMLLPGGAWSGPAALTVAGGRIAAVEPGPADSSGTLTPGLIDLHNNGAFGEDFASATSVGWRHVLASLAARGVTAVQPTVITAPIPAIIAAMGRMAAIVDAADDGSVTRVLGVHLEGPFLSPTRRGAHRAEWLQDPVAALDALLNDAATRRMLRTITLAPERLGGLDAVRRLRALGVVVAIGHSDADATMAGDAAAAGVTMVTHLFNAMRPMGHRDPGLPGVALTDARLWCCLIGDAIHVGPLMCRIAFAAAGARLVLVTDSIAVAGLPPGSTRMFGGAAVRVGADGAGRRPDGTLSGAGIVLDEAVRRMIAAGVDAAAVLHAATEAPANALRRTDLGRLAAGACADLVLWNDAWMPQRVWIGGTEVAVAR